MTYSRNYVERVTAALSRRSLPERRAIVQAIKPIDGKRLVTAETALKAVTDVVLAGDRTLRKRDSDRATDDYRRCLVGARLPRELAECYRSAAKAKGLSLYRWVAEALQDRYRLGW